MFDQRIEGIFGVESSEDVLKLLDEKLISQKIKLNQQEKQLLEAQKKVSGKSGSTESLVGETATEEEPKEKNWMNSRSLTGKFADVATFGLTSNMGKTGKEGRGGPREDAGIEGFDSPEMGGGTQQPGTSVDTQISPIPVTKTWFVDNFGMQGNEIVDLLVKSGKDELVQVIAPLIVEERKALLKSFPSVSQDLVETLPFNDFDWKMLQKNTQSLEIPFRRFVKSWSDGDQEKAYELWSNRITKEQHLSRPERKTLEKTQKILEQNGSMNAQSLQSYGVQGNPTKIAMLIKSHGFLYDIVALGTGKKNNDQAKYYSLKKNDLFVKDAGALIGNLFDDGGSIEISPRGTPRIIIPFNSKVRKEYANALNIELGVAGIIAEGDGLVIEGEFSVTKAIEVSLPHLREKRSEVVILKKALEDDKDALFCLNFSHSSPNKQVDLLKSRNISPEQLEELKKGVING
jgi:hypothetical protein